jgi:hypothetical protein
MPSLKCPNRHKNPAEKQRRLMLFILHHIRELEGEKYKIAVR